MHAEIAMREAALTMQRPTVQQLSTLTRAHIAARKIAPFFPDTFEGRLFRAVVQQTIVDAVAPEPCGYSTKLLRAEWRQAREYLHGPMPHADTFDIDADWIRRILRELDIMPPDAEGV